MILIVSKIAILAVLCVWSSITDIKEGIVSNKLILIAAAAGLITNLIGWILLDSSYLITQLTNICIVWLISILMYAFHIWAGGDCKLMLVVSFIIPYELYVGFANKSICLVFTLAFTFGLGYIYLIGDSIACAIRHKKKINKSEIISKIKGVLFRWVSCIAYVTLVDQLIYHFIPEALSKYSWILMIINICVILIITGIKILQNKYVILAILIAGIAVKIGFSQPLFDRFALINYALAVLFILLRLFISEYDYETIETSSLKKGMILSVATTLQFSNSKVKDLPGQSSENLKSRLTCEEVESVKRWANSKYGTDTVEIVRKMPFAVFISSGAVIFIVLGAINKWF